MTDNGTYPTAESLGEFGLIDRIVARLGTGDDPRIRLGSGDDAAVLASRGEQVVSVDFLIEGLHFRREWSDAADVGVKAVGRSLADVAAMGARPLALLVGFGLPPGLALPWVDALADGMRSETTRAGASVVGGDVSAAEQTVLAMTAIGDLDGLAPVTRAGARPGDVVAVVGRIGWAAAGFAVLAAGLDPGSPEVTEAVAAHRRPRVDYAAARGLAEAGATSMIDISDGLLADLGHVAAASGARIDLRAAALPLAPPVAACAAELGVDPTPWLLTGGEDHAFACTLPPTRLPQISGIDLVVVGEVSAGVPALTVDGKQPSGAPGWRHF